MEVNLHTEIYGIVIQQTKNIVFWGVTTYRRTSDSEKSTAPIAYLFDEGSRSLRNDDKALTNYSVTPQTIVLLIVTGVRTSNVIYRVFHDFRA